jgi:hypothetical protein
MRCTSTSITESPQLNLLFPSPDFFYIFKTFFAATHWN